MIEKFEHLEEAIDNIAFAANAKDIDSVKAAASQAKRTLIALRREANDTPDIPFT